MLPERELNETIAIAKKYGIGQLYLIGSTLREDVQRAHDYDFAVKGVPSGRFFAFYGELYRTLSKNVDLIDLSGKMTQFKRIVLREAKLIYDKRSN